MARAVLFAESYEGVWENRRSLIVDERVIVDMKVSIDTARSEESGKFTVTRPTYAVFPQFGTSIEPSGHILKKFDIDWLETNSRPDNGPILCRVNQLNMTDTETGKNGFLVEILSGLDARQLIRAERHEQAIRWATEHWWQIGFALAVAWWWF